MTTQFFGERILRNEDPQLLTGNALFVDDVHLPNMAHAAFVRSVYAHARIKSIDVSAALQREGVIAVFTAADMGDYWQPCPLVVPPPPIKDLKFNERTQLPLVKDKVRHVGEAIAVIIAENRYIAEDAIADVYVDYEPLEVVLDLEKALKPDAPLLFEELKDNVAAHVIQQKGDYATAKTKAAVVVKKKFFYDRGVAAAMENRGIVAQWDRRAQQMTVWDTTQAPIPIRNGLAARLGLSAHQVRVVAPYLGGGFGPKVMMLYPEEVVLPWAAIKVNRPVKWIEDRQENFFATSHERFQTHTSEIALASDGKIIGIRDVFLHDSGAYDPYGLTVPINSQCTLLGPYLVPNYYSEFTAVFTNRTIVTPYRGAGRQHGVFVMERLLDMGAKELGIDRAEIRKRNFIPPDQFPHNHEIIYQDFAPLTYDSGNYAPALEKAKKMIGYDAFPAEQKRARAEGKHLGLGIVSYVEGTGIGPYEGARVTIGTNGKVSVVTGVGTQGQGHFTSFAQIVADQIGVDVRDISVVTGDTAEFHWGAGTFASRGAVVAGNACYAAGQMVRSKILKLAGEVLEAPESDLEIADGKVTVKGQPDSSITLGDLAGRANPMRGAVKPGTEPGLEATAYFGPSSGTTASGVHAMILEVDPETMLVKINKYVVVHDCGKMINPMIVEGQVHGGVAQGIGNAFYEQLFYDDNGQLLNASFMDYLLPTANDVPHIDIGHEETPSPLNPMGVKGVGEAGAIPVGALFAQAVEDALEHKIEVLEIPLSPNRLFELVNAEH